MDSNGKVWHVHMLNIMLGRLALDPRALLHCRHQKDYADDQVEEDDCVGEAMAVD